MISIAARRECFFDDYLSDTSRTTAEFRLHEPVRRECVMVHNAPWEGDGCDFHNVVREDGFYRMYYLGWWMLEKGRDKDIYVCYAESRNGLTWEKPDLGLVEFEGSKHNNIILDRKMHGAQIDNFMVFKDTHPNCREDNAARPYTSFIRPYRSILS